MRNKRGGLKRNMGKLRLVLPALLAWVCINSAAGEAEPDAELKSYLPLIPESSYTYNFTFKERKGTETLLVKSAMQAGVALFYFVRQKGANNPETLLQDTSFGLGVYVKQQDGIATLHCYNKSMLNSLAPKNPALILKSVPEAGQSFTVANGDLKHTYRVEGREVAAVPAGTFKDCIKVKIEETQTRKPPEKDVTTASFVWLAPGVGVVKWQRVTGRIDELAAYKLAPRVKTEK